MCETTVRLMQNIAEPQLQQCETTVRLMQNIAEPQLQQDHTPTVFRLFSEASLVPTAGIAPSACAAVLALAQPWFSLPVRPLPAPASLTELSWRAV